MPAEPVRVFAIEDTALQLHWRALPAGPMRLVCDWAEVLVDGSGAPGAADLGGLPPSTPVVVTVEIAGRRVATARATTLAPPPGRLLARFASVNDLHIGEPAFGLLRPQREPDAGGLDAYPVRCARAAIAEALAWGAQAVVVKGDLTWSSRAWQFETVGRLLAEVEVPVLAVLGNHDVGTKGVDGRPILACHGIDIPDVPFHLDLPGVRLVLAHTVVWGSGAGRLDARQREGAASLVAAAPAAYVGIHHYPQRFRLPNAYPTGVPGPQAAAFLDAVAAANPRTLVSSGHSHRHRRHRHGPLVVTEIGSTKDYPGAWAGYAVHEGGIRQVVRRVAEPSALAWTERTRRAAGGAWGRWSPGLRTHRCFSHPWP